MNRLRRAIKYEYRSEYEDELFSYSALTASVTDLWFGLLATRGGC